MQGQMASKHRETGEIRSDSLYTYGGLKRTLGWGIAQIRTARQKGLPVHRLGRQPLVLGRDLLAFAEGLETDGSEDRNEA